MHQQHVAGAKVGHQIFGAAAEAGHGLALQPRDKVLLEWKPQVFAPDFGFHDFDPSMTGCRPRRTVSTSGNSGMASSFTLRR